MDRKLILAVLLVAGCLADVAEAAPHGCRGGMMNATQYSYGGRTASGQRFHPDGLTAAHKRLPFGTRVRITNPRSGASTIVVINDRGPFTRGRDIDLARGAARAIGLSSVGRVCADIL